MEEDPFKHTEAHLVAACLSEEDLRHCLVHLQAQVTTLQPQVSELVLALLRERTNAQFPVSVLHLQFLHSRR